MSRTSVRSQQGGSIDSKDDQAVARRAAHIWIARADRPGMISISHGNGAPSAGHRLKRREP